MARLFGITGNAWEWCSDWFHPDLSRHGDDRESGRSAAGNDEGDEGRIVSLSPVVLQPLSRGGPNVEYAG